MLEAPSPSQASEAIPLLTLFLVPFVTDIGSTDVVYAQYAAEESQSFHDIAVLDMHASTCDECMRTAPKRGGLIQRTRICMVWPLEVGNKAVLEVGPNLLWHLPRHLRILGISRDAHQIHPKTVPRRFWF